MKILIAVDDTPPSRRAVELVGSMRWPAGSRVIVASVSRAAPPDAPRVRASDAHPDERCRKAIEDARARLRGAGLCTESAAAAGDPREVLLELAARERADLLVTGSRGRRGLAGWISGSVSSHAVGHAPCSVLVARRSPGSLASGSARSTIAKIVIGVDDSPQSRAAVELVRKMPWREETRVVVASAVSAMVPPPAEIFTPTSEPADLAADRTLAHERLAEDCRRLLDARHLHSESRAIHGDPGTALIECAAREAADLLVVGSHSRTGIAGLVMGSVARHVVSRAPCSVLVVKQRH